MVFAGVVVDVVGVVDGRGSWRDVDCGGFVVCASGCRVEGVPGLCCWIGVGLAVAVEDVGGVGSTLCVRAGVPLTTPEGVVGPGVA